MNTNSFSIPKHLKITYNNNFWVILLSNILKVSSATDFQTRASAQLVIKWPNIVYNLTLLLRNQTGLMSLK